MFIRTLRVLPGGCRIKGIAKKLYGELACGNVLIQMSGQEIAAARQKKQPAYDQLRRITCSKCTIPRCPNKLAA
jgi:hypothetical protein